MNSKERVLKTIDLEEPDYIACDFQGTKLVVERLMKHFCTDSYKVLLEKLGVDIVNIRGQIEPVWIGPMPKVVTLDNGVRQNYLGFQMKTITTEFGDINEHCGFIFENAENIDEMEKFNWPVADWFDFTGLGKRLDEYDQFAVMAAGVSVYQHPMMVRGTDKMLCDMVIAPETAEYLIDKYTNFYIEYFSRMFDAAKGRIDILRIADDLGMQDRTLISPMMFAEFVKPRVKKVTDMAHSYGVKVMLHSCGSIVEFIEEMIDVGVDILDPIQTKAKGMDPEILKKRFGGRICFHGSIDTQSTLPQGTPEEVENEVFDRIEVFGKKGFIIAPSHTLQPDVPMENIISLYDSIHKYR